MERVETLIKKLQEQFAAKAPASQLLLTAQMLGAELAHLQTNTPAEKKSAISVDFPQSTLHTLKTEEEKIIEVLQVDEAAIEAELEEIKRNAEAMQKISVQNKPSHMFEEEEQHIPTLAHHLTGTHKTKKEINETIVNNGASLNDKLKQTKIDLGDTLTEVPIRDFKKGHWG